MRFSSCVIFLFVAQSTSQITNTLLSDLLSEVGSIYSSVTSVLGSTPAPETVQASITSHSSSAQALSAITVTTSSDPSSTSAAVPTSLDSTSVSDSLSSTITPFVQISFTSATSTPLSTSSVSSSSSSITINVPVPLTTTPATTKGLDHDRVVAIAVGTVLGALVLGLIILLGIVLFRRRRQSRQGSLLQADNDPPTTGLARRGSRVWFGSGRNKQDQPTTTTQPLMSQGSPHRGFSSSNSERIIHPAHGEAVTLEQNRIHPGVSESHADNRQDAGHARSRDQQVDFLRLATERRRRNVNVFPLHSSARQVDPLAAHPASSADIRAAASFGVKETHGANGHALDQGYLVSRRLQSHEDFLDLSTEGEAGSSSNANSSISRGGFANAMAGVGLGLEHGADPSDPATMDRAPYTALENENLEATVSRSEKTTRPTTLATRQQPEVGTRFAKPTIPRLSIPDTLFAGRRRSKRTRFDLDAGGETSPPTGSWLAGHDADRGARTISPISPEQVAPREYAYSPLQEDYVPNNTADTRIRPAPPGATYPISHSAVQSPRLVSGLGPTTHTKINSSGSVSQLQHLSEHEQQLARESNEGIPNRATMTPHPSMRTYSRGNIHRKPVPPGPNLVTRKPVPFYPPTSKYAQAVSAFSQPYRVLKSPTRFPSIHGYGSEYKYSSPIDDSAPLLPNQRCVEADKGNEQTRPTVTNVGKPQWSSSSRELQVNSRDQPQQAGKEQKRETLQWWDEEANREYARMYGGYYGATKTPTMPPIPSPYQSRPPTLSAHRLSTNRLSSSSGRTSQSYTNFHLPWRDSQHNSWLRSVSGSGGSSNQEEQDPLHGLGYGRGYLSEPATAY